MSLLNLAGFLSSNLGAFMTHLLEVNEAETWIRWVEGCCCWWLIAVCSGVIFQWEPSFGGIKVDTNLWVSFQGISQKYCIVWVGNIMTPGVLVDIWR